MDNKIDLVPLNGQTHEPKYTIPFLSKFEKAQILGTRALQISLGAPIDFDVPASITDPLIIAEMELEKGKTPFIIRRYFPDGSFEDVSVSYLIKHDNPDK